jgi:WXG100 family type VII secretion target
MKNILQVRAEALTTSSVRLRQEANELLSAVASMRQIQAGVTERWAGKAQMSFVPAVEAALGDCQKLGELLEEMGDKLAQNAALYTATDQQGAKDFRAQMDATAFAAIRRPQS